MFKKLLLTFGILSIMIGLSPGAWAFEYEDVPRESENFYAVDYLRRNDVFMDTRFFRPDLVISKAEFIKYLVLLNSPDFVITGKTPELPFEDTRNNAWYAPYLEEAIRLGILYDWQKNIYPNKRLTMVEALELVFHSQSIPIPLVFKGNHPYKDLERNPEYTPLVMRALSFDLIRPRTAEYVGIFRQVDRETAARMIYKMELINIGSHFMNSSGSQTSNKDPELQKLISVWELINESYIDLEEVDRAKVVDGTIKELVNQLEDPYSTYLDSSENIAFMDELNGELEGIGAVIGFNEAGDLTIVSPIPGSPAEKAGLKASDVIRKVDGTDMAGKSLTESVTLIKGPKGTEVDLTIERKGENRTITVVRDLIIIPSIEYETIDGGKIMYVKLYQFNEQSTKGFDEVVDIIDGSNEIRGLIIDVRDNPGGLLESAVSILSHLTLPEAELVNIEYTDYSQSVYNNGTGALAGFPMAVLINEGSASASEILAGALQDYDAAAVIGEKSFGKGTVQELNYFQDDSSLKLTVAKWFTPLNNDIQKNSVIPGIQSSDLEGTSTDETLERAISELRRQF
jgi:carboxyl-terminal processing protease